QRGVAVMARWVWVVVCDVSRIEPSRKLRCIRVHQVARPERQRRRYRERRYQRRFQDERQRALRERGAAGQRPPANLYIDRHGRVKTLRMDGYVDVLSRREPMEEGEPAIDQEED